MTQTLIDDAQRILEKLGAANWWQGSLIHKSCIAELSERHQDCEWWIVASQACNIYSPDFDSVPVVELIGAIEISELAEFSNGSHPRIIDLTANSVSDERALCLRAELQKRLWIPRAVLANLRPPQHRLVNQHVLPYNAEGLWLDKFSSWLARSYTRVALPNEFNGILASSKIRDVLEAKLAKKKQEALYGIFLTIQSADTEEKPGELGLWTPPYDLGLLVACYEDADPVSIRGDLVKQLFEDQVKTLGNNNGETTSRAELAKTLGIRMIKEDVDVRSISDINLSELLGLGTVRYSMVDYYSSSSASQI